MVGKMKKISFLFVFLYFITLLFVVACSETGELPVISRKTKCSTFAKHFVPKSHLLTQFKM